MQRILQPSFAGGEMSPALSGRVDIARYQTSLAKCRNFIVLRTGGVSNRPGLSYLGPVADHGQSPTLIPFRFNNTTQVCLLEFGHYSMRVWYRGGLVNGVNVATPYSATEAAELSYTQAADVMFLAHANHPPRKLSRTSWSQWSFATMTFIPTMPAPSFGQAERLGNLHTYKEGISYRVTAVSQSTGEESLPSGSFLAEGPTADDWPVGTKMFVTWGSVSGADYYRVYKNQNGIAGYVGTASSNNFLDTNITPDLSDTPPEANNPFSGSGNYPSLVTLHQQRLVFAASNNHPNAVWMSRTGFFESMSKSSPTKDDDMVLFSMASGQVNAIRGMVSMQDLILLTSGSEEVCSGGESGRAVTPSSIAVKRQSSWGASKVPPLVSGSSVLFVQGMGSAVRDLGYEYATDGYKGNDLAVMSSHLLEGYSITGWAYAQIPHSIIWMVRSDGALLSLTYFKEQAMTAWALHTTPNGSFERVAVIEGDDRHEIYVVVKRTVNGQTRRYVERLATRQINSIQDAAFLDSHLVYHGTATQTLTGLDHLNGESVGILADGNVLDPITVSNGSITLPRAYSHIVVGLAYDQISYVETMDMDPNVARGQGSAPGRVKNLPMLALVVDKSREFKAGPDLDHLTTLKTVTDQYGAVPELATSPQRLALPAGWNSRGKLVIQPSGPVPLTILAIAPDISTGE